MVSWRRCFAHSDLACLARLRRYSVLEKRALRDLVQMRSGMAFLSLSASMWLALFVLIFAVDRGRTAGWIEQNVSPITLALINVPMGAGGIACSRLGRKSPARAFLFEKRLALQMVV
jgi:hypothetical protein